MDIKALTAKLSTLSHDLNNVVITVAGSSAMLQHLISENEAARSRMEVLDKSVARLQTIADELEAILSTLRPESEKSR